MFDSPIIDTKEHHATLRDSVRKVVAKFGRRYFQDIVLREEKPDELWRELGAAGFLGAHIAEEYGGGGGGLADLNVIVEEVAAQGCPLLYLVIQSICAPIIAKHGSDRLKDQWLPGLAAGTKKMAFAITEPGAGSNTYRITTTVARSKAGWILRGSKVWTSGIDEADAVLVVARDGELSTAERACLSLFVVPRGAKGVTYQPIQSALQSPTKSFTVFFDDVELDSEALIGRPGNGLRQVFAGLNPERVTAAALNNGISRFAIRQAAEYANGRSVWKTSIGAHQGVSHPLAESYIGVQAARLMTARAAQLYDEGKNAADEANMAKFMSADASLKALDQAIQVHGGNGLSNEYGLADMWFIARLHKTAPLSREMILNYVAQHCLGLPKSY